MSSLTEQDVDVVDNDTKTLALDSNTGSKNAICLSSYGAFMAVDMLSPSGIREVFSNTPPAELREVAGGVFNNIQDCDTHTQEGTIKDLAFKRQVLLDMAENNTDGNVVEAGDDGRFEGSDVTESDNSDDIDPLEIGQAEEDKNPY